MLKVVTLFTICCFHYLNSFSRADVSKVDANLLEILEAGSTANVVVWFHNGVRSAIETASAVRYADLTAKREAIVAALEENADLSQNDVIHTLSVRSANGGGFSYFRKFWTSNKLFIKDADKETIYTVAEDPKVSRIQIEPVSKIPVPDIEPVHPDVISVDDDDDTRSSARRFNRWRWNMHFVKGYEAWDELGGNMGEGVVVAAIDTGARHTHKFLRNNYRGEYGWYDGVNGSLEPYDPVGHGSHVLGILVGHNPEITDEKPLGIAPGATWMACLACPTGDCHYEHIMNCITFISCPTLPDGSNRDCSKAPHVLNFSVGGERSGEPYDEDFSTLRALGIIPVCAIGNAGSNCGTTESPGQWEFCIGVGATKPDNMFQGELLWGLSSIGPAFDGRIQPDIVAPGVNVFGPVGDDDEFLYMSAGTSNAAPLVAGVVALLHVRNPELTYEEAYDLLTQNTDTDVVNTIYIDCNESSAIIPNNLVGWGRLNALKAVSAQTATLKRSLVD